MAFRALGAVRVGVLISLTITGLLLWLARTAWWSERTDVGGFRDVEVGLTGFGGSPFVWCAAGACIAFVVSALPLRPRLRRAATGAGLAATAAAAIVWAVLVARVLRRDAEAYRGWASEVWARRFADPATGPGPALTETSTPGSNIALVVVFLLLMIGCVLAAPRRHERSVLLTATMVNAAAGLAATVRPIWITTGPQTVEPDWYVLPDLVKNETASAVALAALVPLLGIGLLLPPERRTRRGWAVAWAATACVFCYASYGVMMVELSSANWSLGSGEVGGVSPLPAGPGAGITGLLVLAIFLPLVASTRVAFADAAARKQARWTIPAARPMDHRNAAGSDPGHAFGEQVPPDDVLPVQQPAGDIPADDVPPDDVPPVGTPPAGRAHLGG